MRSSGRASSPSRRRAKRRWRRVAERSKKGGPMRSRLGAFVVAIAMAAAARAQVSPGMTIDKSTANQAKDLLPAEILKHYQAGEYKNPVVDFPTSKFRWDDGFDEATKRNAA